MFMRRRPLLRAAAVGGGAYALGSRHAQARQQEASQDERIDDLESQQAPPQAAPAADSGVSSDTIERLEQLGKLHEQGVLTDDEFTSQKQRLLAG
jgi:Short C-terminal domain